MVIFTKNKRKKKSIKYMQPIENHKDKNKIPSLKLGRGGVDRFVQENRAELSEAVLTAITAAVDLGLETVEVFEIEELGVVFSLSREEMNNSLDGCLDYFQSVEEYEKCNKIINLKTKV
jgi:hypothetical protein